MLIRFGRFRNLPEALNPKTFFNRMSVLRNDGMLHNGTGVQVRRILY
jgi:hypothetical protein